MSLQVLSPGLFSSLQDDGRAGYLDRGLPPSGALDGEALGVANALAGNPSHFACVEMLGMGPTLEVRAQRVRLALAGDVSLRIDGRRAASWRSHTLHEGQVVELGAVSPGRAAYLAVEGGFDLPPVLNSLSTYARGGLGTLLHAGTALPLVRRVPRTSRDLLLPRPDLAMPTLLRVVAGPQDSAFTPDSWRQFETAAWRVTEQSDRMGLRLEGPKLIHRASPGIAPEGLVKGCIQVPGDGQPILLLADHQTTGGYAKIATVISADLAAAGRLAPGTSVRFRAVSWQQARQALMDRCAEMKTRLATIRPAGEIDINALMSANLISGAVDALE